jgi:Glu-tRNA(Gln) amidotransferase subunit E-like FAD-binding protein
VQYWERTRRLHAAGVPADAIDALAFSPLAPLFDEAVDTYGFTPLLAAVMLHRHVRRLRRAGHPWTAFPADDLRAIMAAVRDGHLTPDGILDALRKVVAGTFDAAALAPRMSATELAPVIARAKQAVEDNGILHPERLPVLTLDAVMDAVRGRIPGAEAAAAVRAHFGTETL